LKDGLGVVVDSAGGETDIAGSISRIDDAVFLGIIDIQVDAAAVGDDSNSIGLVQANIDVGGEMAGEFLARNTKPRTVVEVVHLIILADAKEILLAVAAVGTQDDATAVSFDDRHIYLEREVAKGRPFQITRVEGAWLIFTRMVASIREKATGFCVPVCIRRAAS